jgi:protein-S-isoprenylcysteine O-methyltransferase Ste14
MLKISLPDIETVPQPSSDLADRRERGQYFTFQGLMRFLRSLHPLTMTLRYSFFSETHGRKFYRFFAFEFFFILVLANFHFWLRNPFTVFRIFTWIILLSSFVIAGYGVYHLIQRGKPQSSGNADMTNSLAASGIYKYINYFLYTLKILSGIEKTTCLVTSGIYKYIRHPIYSAIILLGAVTLLKNDFPWLALICLFLVATAFLYATALIEEKENLLKFGEDYAVYMKRTGMFFPPLP